MPSNTHERTRPSLSPRELEAERERALHAEEVSDWLGGHLLAWLGGIATLAGIVLFLVVAISRGWVGIDARVALGGAGSALLVALGAWLHNRRGRTEASIVAVGVGVAGMFASLVVAGEVYALIPPLLAVGASIFVGALATFLAIRWAGQAIGALGLLGALLSPVLVGAPADGVTTAIVLVASGAAMWTVVSQRWGWLGVATILAGASQWGRWILMGQPTAVDLAVLAAFTAVGLAGALAPKRAALTREAIFPLALVALNASLAGAIGWIALYRVAGEGVASGWLGGLAVLHLALGLLRTRHLPVSEPMRRVLVAIGVVLADAAFGLSVHGLALAIGWGVAAVGFAWLTRRRGGSESDSVFLGLGVGAHVSLTLVRVCLLALPSWTGGGSSQLVVMLAVGTLAASSLACGHLVSASRSSLASGLNALGLAAIAYLTFVGLTGSALVAAWAFEGAALAQLYRQTDDEAARYGGLGFLALAAGHVVVFDAPPTSLVIGAPSLVTAAVAIGAVAVATFRIGQIQTEGSGPRRWLLGAGAGWLLYLMSVAIITAFQPASGGGTALLDLGIRQFGQVVLSAAWSLLGVATLIVGLRWNKPLIRNGALGALLLIAGKVFLYDLSTLTSLYRVMSFIALGLLLLAAAFAYQRLKPPPALDMRSVHPSQR